VLQRCLELFTWLRLPRQTIPNISYTETVQTAYGKHPPHYTSILYLHTGVVIYSYIPQSVLFIVFYMAATSDIYVNQINKGLGSFRHLFESTRAELGIAASQDAVQVVFSTVATAGRPIVKYFC
jgi:hypothetical protein